MSLNRELRNKAKQEGAFNARMMKVGRVMRRVFENGNIVEYDTNTKYSYICLDDERLEERVQLYTADGQPYEKQPKLKNIFQFLAKHPEVTITK